MGRVDGCVVCGEGRWVCSVWGGYVSVVCAVFRCSVCGVQCMVCGVQGVGVLRCRCRRCRLM